MRPTKLLNLLARNAKRGEFRAEGNTIYLYDVIVGSDFEAEFWGGVSPEGFLRQLKAMTGPVKLRVNSPGGDVFAARAIAQAMREYDGEITAIVDGLAASSASFLIMAAAKRLMAPGSFLMIHDAWCIAMGNEEDLRSTADLLAKIDVTIAETYAATGSLPADEFAALMDAETWFTPAEALAAGLTDEVVAEGAAAPPNAKWDLTAFEHPPADEVEAEPVVEPAAAPITELDEPVSPTTDQAAAAAEEIERAARIEAAARVERQARSARALQPAD